MIPQKFLLTLICQTRNVVPKAVLPPVRTLTTSQARLKQCEDDGGGSRDYEKLCKKSQPCNAGKKMRVKRCDKLRGGQDGHDSVESPGGGLPDMCSRQAALDCARKLEELQKQWEAVAKAAGAVEAAESAARGAAKRGKGCPVKPPPEEEKEGSSMLLILGALVVIGGVVYYIYTQNQDENTEEKDKPPSSG